MPLPVQRPQTAAPVDVLTRKRNHTSSRRWVSLTIRLFSFIACRSVLHQRSPTNIVSKARNQSAVDTPSESLFSTSAGKTPPCPRNLFRVDDVAVAEGRGIVPRIPKVVYQKAASRCVHPEFAKLMDNWKMAGWSYHLYDDAAMNDFFFMRAWPEFPLLIHVLKCIQNDQTTKTDLWRYLVIWEHGGLYVDMDMMRTGFNDSVIHPDDDGIFCIDEIMVPSMSFFAARPHHPIMYFAVQHALQRLLSVGQVNVFNPADITGPNCLKAAFETFMESSRSEELRRHVFIYRNFTKGVYVGKNNWTARLLGPPGFGYKRGGKGGNGYILHDPFGGRKHSIYREMNMTHFTNAMKTNRHSGNRGNSCLFTIIENSQEEIHLFQSMAPKQNAPNKHFEQCKPGYTFVDDSIKSIGSNKAYQQNIPKIIHQIAHSRCVEEELAKSMTKWKTSLPTYSYCLYDEQDLNDYLLADRTWFMFPHLGAIVRNCLHFYSRSVKQDIFRFLLLWVHGGIYSDLDTIPTGFIEGEIQSDAQAYFALNKDKEMTLMPKFVAASPHHPIIYFALQHSLLHALSNGHLQGFVHTTNADATAAFATRIGGELPTSYAWWYLEKGLQTFMAPEYEMNHFRGRTVEKKKLFLKSKVFGNSDNHSVGIFNGVMHNQTFHLMHPKFWNTLFVEHDVKLMSDHKKGHFVPPAFIDDIRAERLKGFSGASCTQRLYDAFDKRHI